MSKKGSPHGTTMKKTFGQISHVLQISQDFAEDIDIVISESISLTFKTIH